MFLMRQRGTGDAIFFLCADAFEDPAQSLNQVSLLTAEERERILVEFNQTETPLPEKQRLPVFELQVAKTPDAIALVLARSGHLSRAQQRANQPCPLSPKARVGQKCSGVCMERSIEMIVGVLAIVKAGGAYVL
jgi:non-ribosomal peptide synthetase component F